MYWVFELGKSPEILLYTSLDKGNTLPYDIPKILLKTPVKMLQKKRNKELKVFSTAKNVLGKVLKWSGTGRWVQLLSHSLHLGCVTSTDALPCRFGLTSCEPQRFAGTHQKRQRNSSRQSYQRTQHSVGKFGIKHYTARI